jgi:hypothetical protein
MFLETLAAAMLAAALALVGNYVLLRFQTQTKVREERRQFVRELHGDTVDLLVDVDLFVRSLRSSAVAGTTNSENVARVREVIQVGWEGDLLRRVRRARFGHPDPDVRDAAERVDDEMWPFIVMASSPERERGAFPHTKTPEERLQAVRNLESAMVELRRAVYGAPHRDVPAIRYTGAELPSRLARALDDNQRSADESDR